MTSHEWQRQIDGTAAEMRAKETRLAGLANAKAKVITDPTKLLLLEVEETELPTAIEQLKRRLPILARELEDAQKTEAGERHREIEKLGEEAASRVTKSTVGIQETMRTLLNQISEAHASWEAYGALVAEDEFLRSKFGLSPIEFPAGERCTPLECHTFTQQFKLLFRHTVVAQPWTRMLTDWKETERREESQQREDEFKERSTGPHYQPIRTVQHAESR